MYETDDIILIFYETIKNHINPGEWDNFRIQLFKLHMDSDKFGCKYFFSCDCDDFYYVNNASEQITKNKIHFHNLEFLPNTEFSLNDDFRFISNHYFFRIKGALKRILTKETSHIYCRTISMNTAVSAPHTGHKTDICSNFNLDSGICDLSSLNNICFSFGCLSKKHLINNELFWDQSVKDNKMINEIDTTELNNNFDKYYTITKVEESNNIILTINEMKKFFE